MKYTQFWIDYRTLNKGLKPLKWSKDDRYDQNNACKSLNRYSFMSWKPKLLNNLLTFSDLKILIK